MPSSFPYLSWWRRRFARADAPATHALSVVLTVGTGGGALQTCQSDLPPTSLVGSTTEDVEVRDSGAASYVVPLELPPDPSGFAPQLSISYHSQQGNGPLGVGWDLSGISTISRCAATPFQDGMYGTVTYGAEDRFCLDGQRLIEQPSSGAGKRAFYLEQNPWHLVEATGDCTQHCSFSVTARDGMRIDYGTSDDSRAYAEEVSVPYLWAMDRSTDRHGNAFVVAYQHDGGTVYPAAIDYTLGNGRTAERRVDFEYETRPTNEVLQSEERGKTRIRLRLRSISTSVYGRFVKAYRLAYAQGTATGRSRITEIRDCYDASESSCRLVNRASYADLPVGHEGILPAPIQEEAPVLSHQIEPGTSAWLEDVTGDGLPDLIYEQDGTRKLYGLRATGTTFVEESHLGTLSTKAAESGRSKWTVDVDADGIEDIVYVDGSSKLCVMRNSAVWSTSESMFGTPRCEAKRAYAPSSSASQWFADVNGDKRVDFVYVSKSWNGSGYPLLTQLNTGGTFSSTALTLFTLAEQPDEDDTHHWLADFDGDSRPDLFYRDGTALHWLRNECTPSRTSQCFTLPRPLGRQGDEPENSSAEWFADVNGDGLADYVYNTDDHYNGAREIRVRLNVGGVALRTESKWGTTLDESAWNRTSQWLADFNGDGLVDYFYVVDDSDKRYLRILSNNGGMFAADIVCTSSTCDRAEEQVAESGASQWVADANGDGTADYVYIKHARPTSNKRRVMAHLRAGSGLPDLMTQLVDGLNKSTGLSYLPLTQSSVYTRGTGAVFPQQDIVTTGYVVHAQTVVAGLTTSVTRHTYQGARVDLNGRGWLGFKSHRVSKEALGSELELQLDQTYPRNGMVTREVVWSRADAANVVLSARDYLYDTIVDQAATTAAGKTYRVQKRADIVRHYQVGATNADSPLFSTRVNYTYDAFDNVVVVQQLGEERMTGDEVYTCRRYSNQTAPWRIGFVSQEKTSKLPCDLAGWNVASDLSWTRVHYDSSSRMLVTLREQWNDRAPGGGAFVATGTTYDAVGRPDTAVDPLGNETRTTYAEDDKTYTVTTMLPPNQYGERLTQKKIHEHAFGAMIAEVDANGSASCVKSDGFARPVEELGPDASGKCTVILKTHAYVALSEGGSMMRSDQRLDWDDDVVDNWYWERVYSDPLGRELRVESRADRSGSMLVRETVYNDAGLAIKKSLPYYSARGQAPAPQYVVTRYDVLGNPIQVTWPHGASKTYATWLDRLGDGRYVLQTTESMPSPTGQGESVVKSYSDVRGQMVRVESADGTASRTEYDLLGRVVKRVDGANLTTTYQYSSLGLLMSEDRPDSGMTTYEYDAVGRLAHKHDASQRVESLIYDKLGRVSIKQTLAPNQAPQVANYEYDDPAIAYSRGRLTAVSMPAAPARYEYGFDRYGNVVAYSVEIDGESASFAASYDPRGAVTYYAHPLGDLTYLYRPNGSLKSIAREFDGEMQNVVQYRTPNELGLETHADYGNGAALDWKYDAVGRTLASVLRVGTRPIARDTYTWNLANKVASRATGPVTTVYSYDQAGRLKGATGAGPAVLNYDFNGNLILRDQTQLVYAAGSNRLMASASGDRRWSYDAAGRVLSRERTADGVTHATEIRYDGAGFVSDIEETAGSTVTSTAHITRDVDGRKLRTSESSGHTTYTFGPDYEVLDVEDPDGNVRRVETQSVYGVDGVVATFSRNADASLLSQHEVGEQAVFAIARRPTGWLGEVFGGFARKATELAKLRCFESALRATVLWMLIVSSLGGLWCVVANHRRATPGAFGKRSQHPWMSRLSPLVAGMFLTTVITSTAQASLTAGSNGPGVPVEGVRYFHSDLQRSTTIVMDEYAQVTARLSYDALGALVDSRSSGIDDFRSKFGGHELVAEATLQDFGSRLYDPEWGRFVSPDPAGQYDSPYVLGDSDPVSHFDPDGEVAWAVVAAVGVATLVVSAAFGYLAGVSQSGEWNPAAWDWADSQLVTKFVLGAISGLMTVASVLLTGGGAAAILTAKSLKDFGKKLGKKGLKTLLAEGATVAVELALTGLSIGFELEWLGWLTLGLGSLFSFGGFALDLLPRLRELWSAFLGLFRRPNVDLNLDLPNLPDLPKLNVDVPEFDFFQEFQFEDWEFPATSLAHDREMRFNLKLREAVEEQLRGASRFVAYGSAAVSSLIGGASGFLFGGIPGAALGGMGGGRVAFSAATNAAARHGADIAGGLIANATTRKNLARHFSNDTLGASTVSREVLRLKTGY